MSEGSGTITALAMLVVVVLLVAIGAMRATGVGEPWFDRNIAPIFRTSDDPGACYSRDVGC